MKNNKNTNISPESEHTDDINLFNRLIHKEMKFFCLNQNVKISNQNIQ